MRAEFVLRNDIKEIERLHDWIFEVGDKNGLPQEVVFEVKLAVEEIVSNIIHYGYEDRGKHQISVHFCLEHDAVRVRITDDGQPFNPLDHPAPEVGKPIEEQSPGGLGIFLVRQMMDHVEYSRERETNVLVIRKRVSRSENDSCDSGGRE